MRVYRLECELLSPLGVRETFKVFEDPYNLAKITPPWLRFRILTQNLEMRKGLEIDYEFRWLGLPMRWKTLITEYEPPFLFVDEAAKSPYALWRHRHSFRATEQGTVVADRVDYALPFGPLGRIANAVAVSKQVKEIFTYRQKAIVELLGGRVVEVKDPIVA